METLELKHIAPYLPYSVLVTESNVYYGGFYLVGKKHALPHEISIGQMLMKKYSEYKMILRPLDEIKNFEEIMDEFSVNSLEAFENHFLDNVLGKSLNCFDVVNYTIVELCFKYHLDIFGLIKKGLAIDINTLSDVNNLKNK